MKVTIKGFIQARPGSFNNKVDYSFWIYDDMCDHGYSLVMPHEICFELPAGFDIRAKQVDLLEKEKRTIQAEFTARITQINSRIQSLLAIENTAGAKS